MNAKRLHRRWQASLEARQDDIHKLLRRKRALTGPEVHDLRVALRRARLLAELGAKLPDREEVRKFRSASRAMLEALNTLRDCDVALDWLQTNGGSATLTRRLSLRRHRLWQPARRQLNRYALAKLDFRMLEQVEPKKLRRRLRKEMDGVAADCLKTVKRSPEIPIAELHELRRKVRRWRYLRELEIAPRQIRRDRRLKTLIEVQESLGALHDAEIILDQFRTLGRGREVQSLRASLRAGFAHVHREALQEIKRLTSLA